MTFEQLLIRNFGLYRGEQIVNLDPPSGQRPIVLIGGLNGAGKTTLLDAIQLALYGKRARLSNRAGLAYHDYLRRSMNRSARGPASVDLTFRHRSDGELHRYRVRRVWRVPGKTVVETVEVYVDGALDHGATERWDEIVEQFLPVGISHLLLFDGEQVEALADLQNSTELLQSALDSLLGLDIVEQLGHDLLALERRKRVEHQDKVDRDRLDSLNESFARLDRERDEASSSIEETQQRLKRRERSYKRFEGKFRREGGELAERREQMESDSVVTTEAFRQAEASLRELAAGDAPLLLITSQLLALEEQGDREAQLEQQEMLGSLLADRDAELLKFLATTFSDDVEQVAHAYLARDREARRPNGETAPFLGLDVEVHRRLQTLNREGLPYLARRLSAEVDVSDARREARDRLDSQLAATPDAEAIKHLVDTRNQYQEELADLRATLRVNEERLLRLTNERDEVDRARQKILDKQIAEDFRVEDLGRMLRASARTRRVMARFRQAVLRKHIDRISLLVLESFQALIRKPDLVRSLEIDPDRLTISLIASDGSTIPPERLSAGERQLLAISLIWGLARASGRSLPTVIDTPLGRLDSAHRRHLVERYFPYASHQVVLLTTDEEIDREQTKRLAPFVGQTYHLDHDDEDKTTTIQSGYFWSL